MKDFCWGLWLGYWLFKFEGLFLILVVRSKLVSKDLSL